MNTYTKELIGLSAMLYGAIAGPAHGAEALVPGASDESPAVETDRSSAATATPGTIGVPPRADAQQPPKLARPVSRMIEEVVVTAQKREEALQEVPISIAAFSGGELEARGVGNAAGLSRITPSLVYDEWVGYAVIYMRGVGADLLTPTAEPSVATYVDGVYMPLNHGLVKDFTPVKRIEVLKGPQGTLFGRNATGGAINIITEEPSNSWRVSLQGGIGSFSERRVKAYVSGPATDTLSFSLGGIYKKSASYFDLADTSPLDKLADSTSEGFNARLRWDATEQLEVTLNANYAAFNGTGSVPNAQIDPKPLGLAVGSQRTGPRETAFNEPGTIDAETSIYSATATYKADALDLKFIGAYQDNLTDTRWDYDAGPVPAIYFYPTHQFLKATTGELQLTPNDTSLFSDDLKWVAGVYYYKAKAGFDPMFVGVYRFESASPLQPINDLVNRIQALAADKNILFPESLVNITMRGVLDVEAWASYAQVDWTPWDWMTLIGGARYQTEKRELSKSTVGLTLDGFDDSTEVRLINWVELVNRDLSLKEDDVSPRLALQLRPAEEMMLYASYSSAFKSATFNMVNIYLPPNMVEPEKTTAYEIGAKGSLLDGVFQYSAAVFRNDVEDVQTMILSVASGGLINIVNAAEARIDGIEADIKWQIFPDLLPGQLVLTAAGSYLDGKYTKFPEGSGFDELTGIGFGASAPLPSRDFSGHRTVRTPEYSGTLGLSYTFGVPGGQLEIAGDAYHNSGYFFDPQNVTVQPSYRVVNARVSYLYEPMQLRVTGFVQNIGDSLYYANIFSNDFGKAATSAPPRAYGLTLEWNY